MRRGEKGDKGDKGDIGAAGEAGAAGAAGVGVKEVRINDDMELIVVLTDGTEINAGSVVAPVSDIKMGYNDYLTAGYYPMYVQQSRYYTFSFTDAEDCVIYDGFGMEHEPFETVYLTKGTAGIQIGAVTEGHKFASVIVDMLDEDIGGGDIDVSMRTPIDVGENADMTVPTWGLDLYATVTEKGRYTLTANADNVQIIGQEDQYITDWENGVPYVDVLEDGEQYVLFSIKIVTPDGDWATEDLTGVTLTLTRTDIPGDL